MPKQPPAPRTESHASLPEPVAAGADVLYTSGRERLSATVIRVCDRDADGRIDLVYYIAGEPYVEKNVSHGIAQHGTWMRPAEAPPAKLSPRQEIDAAIARGERVPRIGDEVVFVEGRSPQGNIDITRHYLLSARITAVHSLSKVDVEVFATDHPGPKAVPAQVDAWRKTREVDYRRAGVDHGLKPQGWCFADEVPEGGIPDRDHAAERAPSCSKCLMTISGKPSVLTLTDPSQFAGDINAFLGIAPAVNSLAQLCPSCVEMIRPALLQLVLPDPSLAAARL